MVMRKRIGRAVLVSAAFGAMVVGGAQVAESRAEARPIFLCGPTYLWVCTGPGGPDVLFPGTICEKEAFEQQTGLTCVPFRW